MRLKHAIQDLLSFYRDHLERQVMPFWVKLVDWKSGGINNIVENDGRVLSTDKFMWSQGRALWTFSTLYGEYEQNPLWLEIADNIARFVMKYGRDADGAWVFQLHEDGSVAIPYQSIYVDGFILYGLTAYYRVTKNPQALEMAEAIWRRTSPLLEDHRLFPTMPHPIPAGKQSHGPLMQFALFYHELGITIQDRTMMARSLELAERIMTQHLHTKDKVLYEYIQPGGGLVNDDAGKTYLPGHAIESMWFLERIYRYHNRQDRIATAMEAIRWHIEKGWDNEYGGINLACHTEGGAPVWHLPDSKPWWPVTEALYGLLRAHEVTREPWCLEWYWKVHDYAFERYPNRQHGDWYQNLDRFGKPIPPIIKSLPVKDPFHLPRALLYSIHTLGNLSL